MSINPHNPAIKKMLFWDSALGAVAEIIPLIIDPVPIANKIELNPLRPA